MIKKYFIFFLIIVGIQNTAAQNITGQIVDADTGESLAHANIQVNETENIVSNEEGFFALPDKTEEDVLITISFLGYKSAALTVADLKNNKIIRLQPGVFELEMVYVSNRQNDPDSIMAMVKRNLGNNYKPLDMSVKKMMFFRETSSFRPSRLDIKLSESTGYSKAELKESNAHLNSLTSRLIANPPQQYTDKLCNYYTAKKTVNGKQLLQSKFEVVKAVKLKDKSRSISLDEVEELGAGVLMKHIDTTKYYRVKSGLFGTRDTVLSRNDFRKDEKANENKSTAEKFKLDLFLGSQNLAHSHYLDFARNIQFYEYTFAGTTLSDNDDVVYIINFKPSKRKAKYRGTLYVSAKDYGIIRADYNLAEGKTLSGVNLKFLLGVKQSENASKGIMIFKENPTGSGYYLQYASKETGEYIYINRPVKFIEITDGDKDVVAFDFKVEANMVDKEEYFMVSQDEISETDYDNVKETNFNYIQLDNYDPNIWKEYTTIEPSQEMKQFRTIE